MRASLERVGRFDEQRARSRLLANFDPSVTQRILLDDECVGFFCLREGLGAWRLDQLHLAPAVQGRGLGSVVLAHIVARAEAAGQDLGLGALRRSDSNRFYARHGFVLVSQDDVDNDYVRWATVRSPRPVAPELAAQVNAFAESVIRESVTSDADLLAELTANVRGNVAQWLETPDRCIHLQTADAAGLQGVILVKDHWNLCSLFVAPASRRTGVGRRLVLAAMQACRGLSPRQAIWLNAAPDAVGFYRRLGFTERVSPRALPPGFLAMQGPLPGVMD